MSMELFHTGVLVDDIDRAIERFSRVLGLTFGEPQVKELVDDGGCGLARVNHLPVVYSNEGPPYLELMEAQEDGLWGRHHGEGIHHVGSWTDDLAASVNDLVADGVEVEASLSVGGEVMAVYLRPTSLCGTRAELVGRRPGGGWRPPGGAGN
jgi:catechol 2,3-dioxygenase-like lactoylglutathione lyase family enzyme